MPNKRTLILAGAVLSPSAVLAQGLPATAAFESAADNLASVIPYMFGAVVILAGLGFMFKLFFEGESDPTELLVKLGLPVGLIAGSVALMRFITGAAGGVSEQNAPAPEKDTGPGLLSIAWSWLVDHMLVLGLSGVLVFGGYWLVSRALKKRGLAKQVKLDVKDLIETIERADALVMYWQHIVLPQSLGDGAKVNEEQARDTLAQLERAQEQLLGFLEIAHAGAPLSQTDRSRLAAIRDELNRCMKSPAGEAFDVAGGLAQLATAPVTEPAVQPAKISQMDAGRNLPVTRVAMVPAVATVTGGSPSCAHSDLLDPFNPLSPLSPISLWSIWRREEVHHHHVDSDRPRDDSQRAVDFAAPSDYSPSVPAGDIVDDDSRRSSSDTECLRSDYEDQPQADPEPDSYGGGSEDSSTNSSSD